MAYQKVVKVIYKQEGLNEVITKQKEYNTHARAMGQRVRRLDAQGKVLSDTWVKQQGILSKLGARFLGFAAAITAIVKTYQVLKQQIEESIERFREFEYRMAEVSTILDEVSRKRLPSMSQGVEVLSMKFGKASSDMAKGMYDILSAAFSAEDSLNLLNTATKASIAGISEVRTSVDIFTTVLNAYGMSVAQATQVSDYLFQSVVRGKFQFEELESALGYVVPIAAQAGIEFKELMAALSTTTRHGLHLDMTSRGLALAIQNIINPTEGAKKAAQEYGIDMSALGLRAEGLYGWFKRLHDKTDEYGKNIIPKMIKNMRSLRVAMVLAGEEGILGFADDLEYLESATGRTDEALNEIMKTQQFRANQIRQEFENIQRDWGEMWGEVALTMQRIGLAILRPTTGLGLITSQLQESYPFTQDEITNVKSYLRLLEDMGDSTKFVADQQQLLKESLLDIDEIKHIPVPILPEDNLVLEESAELLNELSDSWNAFTANIQDTQDVIGNLEITLVDLETDLKRLQDELETPYTWGMMGQFTTGGSLFYEKELLIAKRDYADLSHDISMALKDENYLWKIQDQSLHDAAKAVREYEKDQKSNREEMERFNRVIAGYNLEIMKLQLKGMQRRHGLRRSEERQIKSYRISILEERIAHKEGLQAMTVEEYDNYKDNKKILDDALLDSKEHVYQMSYNWDEQISDLDDHIKYEKTMLDIRNEQYNIAFEKLETNLLNHMENLKNILKDPELTALLESYGIDVSGMYRSARTKYKETFKMSPAAGKVKSQLEELIRGNYRGFRGFQRGTYFVPETRPYLLHKGEQVSPAGRQRGGNMSVRVEPITVNAVFTDRSSVRNTGKIIGQAIAAGFISGVNSEFEIG